MADALQRVDKLTMRVIVDNTIEWLTTMPPGFTHELFVKLTSSPPIDTELTGVPFMDLDNCCCGAHGLSILLTTERNGEKYSLLFDTGPDSRAFERNYDAIKAAELGTIERVVLSHWHRDHSGGMLELLKILKTKRNPPAEQGEPLTILDVHPDRPIARGVAQVSNKVRARLPPDPTFEELEAAGGRVEKHSEAHVVGGGAVYVSGEIPRVTPFETGMNGAHRWREDAEGKGLWVAEPHLMEERYIAVDVVGKGLVIFSACSHAGIVNVARDAVEKFKRPIHMLVGGLHLAGKPEEFRIEQTVDFLAHKLNPPPTYVLPMHCSGFKAKIALEKALGEGCVPAGVGMRVEVAGSAADDATLVVPTVSVAA